MRVVMIGLLVLAVGCGTSEGQVRGDCTDREDNDGDGQIDCEDRGCRDVPACDLASEEVVNDQLMTEACRILVLCEFYSDVVECEAASEPTDTTDCVYDAQAGTECVDGLRAIAVCPDPFVFPSACEDVYTCSGDSGM